MKQRLALIAASAVLSLVATAALAQEKVVRVYNWSDYIDDSILKDFTKETGIEVVYDVFDSNEILETKLLAGGTGYDVVVPSAEYLGRQIEAGVFQKLDKSKLPNITNMWDVISKQVATYDPDNAYSVNYMWGTTGIGYNKKKVAELLPNAPTDSWSLVFDPKNAEVLSKCGIDMLDSGAEMITAALHYLGLDPNAKSAEDVQKAEDLLLKVRPFVRKFHSSEYVNGLANGDICVAVGFSGDVFQARDRAAEAGQGVEVAYSIPKEGALLFFDQLAIPADAPHVDNAHAFINYMMKPEVIAKATNYVSYANGNKASQPLVNPDTLADKAVYPDDATLANLYTKLPYDAKTQRLVTRAFTTVKTGQ
ncbi:MULTISPECIES: polyamine ABC transporter substrate-binding protein [unclassified Aureimonas]|uniref:polyamine ABC transporter substrate-binding protein n=1 Tax=unclassified Aureimonas TaxID=2615206 RepID=UPI0006FDEA42|nr:MULTISPECIES: polyamine ABC transporter substrate-binding protein [unclassified Aureimonas]KQT69789.1 spermidine/putrescine ABC transporter substrate-binding protein [Aureimonas sp. Leaf427]KQT76059.1 spermidine/putrescine ABC transporter substrate-binding protein [Aureimonas sp. Leaf460]